MNKYENINGKHYIDGREVAFVEESKGNAPKDVYWTDQCQLTWDGDDQDYSHLATDYATTQAESDANFKRLVALGRVIYRAMELGCLASEEEKADTRVSKFTFYRDRNENEVGNDFWGYADANNPLNIIGIDNCNRILEECREDLEIWLGVKK